MHFSKKYLNFHAFLNYQIFSQKLQKSFQKISTVLKILKYFIDKDKLDRIIHILKITT